jgi:hypothetical protein
VRIGLITTLETNIGDDFIREGIYFVLKEIYKKQKIEFVPVNKHRPMSVYLNWHPCSLTEYIPYGRRYSYLFLKNLFSFYKFGDTVFDDCELIVQCGAPVLWPGCHRAEWAEPLWHQVVGSMYKRIPVLNLAAGSCYPWEEQPSRVSNFQDAEYLRAILRYCRLTTSRDTLAQSLFASLGGQAPFIPCSAFLAAKYYNFSGSESFDDLVLINYMEGGGHYDWGQNISKNFWRNMVTRLIKRVGKRHRIVFLCHNREEYELAKRMNNSMERILPNSPKEYFQLLSKAAVALCNRMHASVGLAGLGIPSVTVGTDTRNLMVKALDLPCYYVKDVNVELLEQDIENLIDNRSKQFDRLRCLQTATMNSYINIISGIL